MQGVPARLVAFLVLVMALIGVVRAADLFRQDLLFTRAETEVSFWGRGDYHPEPATIYRAEQTLLRLLSSAPANPRYLALQANYAAWRGYWTEDYRVAQQFGRQAVDAQYAALESRPAHRHNWAKMVQYASRLEDGKPMRATAQSRVKGLEPVADPN